MGQNSGLLSSLTDWNITLANYRNPCRKCIVSTAQTLLALQFVQNGKKDPCHESRGPRIIQQYSLFSSSRFQAVYIETLVTNDIVVAIVIDLYV